MNQTTKTISLLLISSALVFVGWGCPLGHDNEDGQHTTSSHSSYRTGHTWFWYSSYGGGYSRGPSSGGVSSNTGGVSSRGGFGSTGGASGVSGIS